MIKAYDAVMSPMLFKMQKISSIASWAESALVDGFSLTPLVYISEIGEYLLTLPQQLEPFLSQDDSLFAKALQACEQPFHADCTGIFSSQRHDNAADIWLNAICKGVMKNYMSSVLLIPKLTAQGAHQLSADIDYLNNVMSALDVTTGDDCQNLVQLLTCPAAQYKAISVAMSPRNGDVARVAAIRNIKQ